MILRQIARSRAAQSLYSFLLALNLKKDICPKDGSFYKEIDW
jgi:hypothetical protein